MRKEFSTKTKAFAFQRAGGRCEQCGFKLTVGKYHFDHTNPDGLTGTNDLNNIAVLCIACHREKSRVDVGRISKAKRVYAKHVGARQSHNPLPGGKHSLWKKKLTGEIVPREKP